MSTRPPYVFLRAWIFALAIGACLLSAALKSHSAPNLNPPPEPRTNLPPVQMRTSVRTNLPPGPSLRATVRTNQFMISVRTNPVPGVLRTITSSKTNAVAKAGQPPAKGPSGLSAKLRSLASSRYFYPALAACFLCLGVGAMLYSKFSKPKSEEGGGELGTGGTPTIAARIAKRRTRKVTIQSCNVLGMGAAERKFWQFDARSSGFVLNHEYSGAPGGKLPAPAIKDWRSLFSHKLNVAWLPAESVFLRAAQFPQSEFPETLSMVELQLEKLSPMPVAQIVWNIQVVPHARGDMQTVIVVIVARSVVEEYLGRLEGQGYLADRLELPLLDQLEATAVTEDGAWVYPEAGSANHAALVAWWYGGALQTLALAHLPAANPAAGLREQMLQMAWAGEIEGWLTSPPRWHLVADETTAASWEPALREALEQPVELIGPLPAPRLAALTAARAAQADPLASLLPVEFSSRYRDQFIDRLWMRGLGAIVGLYLLGLLFYFVRLEVAAYFVGGIEKQVADLAPSYTNAMQLKAKLTVLQDRQDLKFAALDCWQKVAELMPEGLTLDGFGLSEGKKLVLNGTAPADQVSQINEFESKLRKVVFRSDQPMFDPNAGEHFVWHANPGGSTVSWNFSLILKRFDIQ